MIKLYETDGYLTECDACVTESFEKDGKYYIRLNQSIFFPEEGGQHADTGILRPVLTEGGQLSKFIRVLDGSVKRGVTDEITYMVSDPVSTGTKVHCILNWDVRYDRMQNHSGEHVLTGVIHNKYGYNNVGFHLSDEGFVTLDLDGSLTYEDAILMEREANSVIYKNLPIIDTYPSKEELKNISYRSKIEIEGQVRLISVGQGSDTVDVCACCAPHVRTTGEIGIIKVISVIKWKKGVQIAILCGRRALSYIEEEHDRMMELSRNLSTSAENVINVVKSNAAEISELKLKLSEAVEGHLIHQIALIPKSDPCVIFTETDLSAGNMKNVYNALIASRGSGAAGIFVGNDETGYRFNAGITGGDARELSRIMKEELSAKGGGSPEMIQGRVSAKRTQIEKLFSSI